MPLSDTKLRSLLNRPSDKLVTITDRDSLSVRVTPKGKIVFQYRYRFEGKGKRYDLGSYPSLSLSDARACIPELKGIIESGEDIKSVKASQRTSKKTVSKPKLEDCMDLFLGKYITSLRESTQRFYQYTLNKYVPNAFEQPVEDITRQEWYAFFDRVEESSTPHMANSLIKKLKTCLNFCKERDFISDHSLNDIRTKTVGASANTGDRTPSIVEIKAILEEFGRSKSYPTTVNVVRMIVLTGARCGEVRFMQSKDINFEESIWTVPKEKSKTNTKIIRPLGPKALELVKWQVKTFGGFSDYVFPSASYKKEMGPATINKMCRAIIKRMDIERWSVHDFRRSLSTILTESSVPLHVTETMLGHHLGGILSVYNKSRYIDEQREAYGLWEKLLSI
jgi:integrase